MEARIALMAAARRLARKVGLVPETVQVKDEYVEWLSYANAGMLDRGNLHCFDLALRSLPSTAPILEIGSFCGLSTNVLAYYKARNHLTNRLITCDAWRFENAVQGSRIGTSRISHEDYRTYVKESFKRNVQFFSGNDLPFTIEVTADQFFELWHAAGSSVDVFGRRVDLGGTIAFAYIDGNHSYEFARRDFDNCDRVLESRGFLLFDDSADESSWEVKRVVREALATGRYRIAAKNPNYLLQKS